MSASAALASDYGLDAANTSLRHYLRALWRRDFRLQPCARPATQLRPYLSEAGIHLPPRCDA